MAFIRRLAQISAVDKQLLTIIVTVPWHHIKRQNSSQEQIAVQTVKNCVASFSKPLRALLQRALPSRSDGFTRGFMSSPNRSTDHEAYRERAGYKQNTAAHRRGSYIWALLSVQFEEGYGKNL